ncbi:MAG: hypothetical protein EXS14_01840 [Planctomycetes bacterium]|nr:hypothetical protein [Planctomycetota bacterium]
MSQFARTLQQDLALDFGNNVATELDLARDFALNLLYAVLHSMQQPCTCLCLNLVLGPNEVRTPQPSKHETQKRVLDHAFWIKVAIRVAK